MHVTDGSKKQWYYNSRTHQVEHGMLSSYEYRMGPYKTRQEAEKALELAKKRNEEWDAEDKRWAGQSDQEGDGSGSANGVGDSAGKSGDGKKPSRRDKADDWKGSWF